MGFLFPKAERAKPIEPANIKATRIGSNQLGRAWPIRRGRHKSGTLWMTDIFDQKAEEVKENVKTGKSSSSEVTKEVKYFLSYAVGIGLGPENGYTKLFAISASDEDLWTGDVTMIGDNTSVIDVQDRGEITFHSGSPTQGRSSLLQTKLDASVPAFRGKMYADLDLFFVGNTEAPPNFEITHSCVSRMLVLDPANATGDPVNDNISFHHIDWNVLLSEFAYEFLVNRIWGATQEFERINVQSFIDASNDYLTDGWAVAPLIEDYTDLRQLMALLEAHGNASIIEKNGQLTYQINKSNQTLISIPEVDFITEPKSTNLSPDSIKSRISVQYQNLDREHEDDPVNSINPVAHREVGGSAVQTLDRQWINKRDQAEKIAAAEGYRRALPDAEYDLEVEGSYKATVFPGNLIDAEGISVPIEVDEVEITEAKRNTVKIRGRATKMHITEQTSFAGGGFEFQYPDPDPVSAFVRIAAVPASLLSSGINDGLFILSSRSDQLTLGSTVYFSSDDTQYDPIDSVSEFGLRITVIKWKDTNNGYGVLDIRFENQAEHDAFQSIVQAGSLLNYFVALGKRYVKSGSSIDEPQAEPIFASIRYGAPIDSLDGEVGYGPLDWRIRVESGFFDTEVWSREDSGNLAVIPTTIGFLGPQSAMKLYESNQICFSQIKGNGSGDMDLVRYIKVATRLGAKTQDVDDATIVSWDRDGIAQTFTADDTTNELTAVAHGHENGFAVYVSTDGGTLPAPLDDQTIYYMVNITTDTFQLSASIDSTPIDLTDAGTGTLEFRPGYGVFSDSWGDAATNDQNIGDPGVPEDQLT